MNYFEELYSFTKIIVTCVILLFCSCFYFVSEHKRINKGSEPWCAVGSKEDPYFIPEPIAAIHTLPKDPIVVKGRQLFESNCTACHAVHNIKVGPALKDISKRRSLKWIRSFVKNPGKMIHERKDPYATALYHQYNKIEMTSFSSFSNKEIDAIVRYIEQASEPIVCY